MKTKPVLCPQRWQQKSLSLAENAFRSLKTVDLKVRPIHHRNADRARSHVFLCLLAYLPANPVVMSRSLFFIP